MKKGKLIFKRSVFLICLGVFTFSLAMSASSYAKEVNTFLFDDSTTLKTESTIVFQDSTSLLTESSAFFENEKTTRAVFTIGRDDFSQEVEKTAEAYTTTQDAPPQELLTAVTTTTGFNDPNVVTVFEATNEGYSSKLNAFGILGSDDVINERVDSGLFVLPYHFAEAMTEAMKELDSNLVLEICNLVKKFDFVDYQRFSYRGKDYYEITVIGDDTVRTYLKFFIDESGRYCVVSEYDEKIAYIPEKEYKAIIKILDENS